MCCATPTFRYDELTFRCGLYVSIRRSYVMLRGAYVSIRRAYVSIRPLRFDTPGLHCVARRLRFDAPGLHFDTASTFRYAGVTLCCAVPTYRYAEPTFRYGLYISIQRRWQHTITHNKLMASHVQPSASLCYQRRKTPFIRMDRRGFRLYYECRKIVNVDFQQFRVVSLSVSFRLPLEY